MNIPKIIIPSKQVLDSNWNKFLPTPLDKGEKCIVDSEQSGVGKDYVRIKHGENKIKSIFHIRNFTNIKGESING